MPATIVITCPECRKQLKGPAEVQGKKIKCKSCGAMFVVKPAAEASERLAPLKEAPPPPKKEENPEDSQSGRAYEMQNDKIQGVARCPQCAYEMENEEAIICLRCGYNSQTRTRLVTVKAVQLTAWDWIKWLGPGVIALLVSLSCIGTLCFLWIFFRNNDAGWVFPLQIWGSVFSVGIGWVLGKFSFRRLCLNPRPPEKTYD